MNIDPKIVYDCVDLLGVLVNGVLGGTVARQLKLDAVGFTFMAVISGLGGGMLRDTLLQAGPPVALTNHAYLICALAGAAVAYFLPFERVWARRTLVVADSLSIGCWAATGTAKGLGAGLGVMPAIMLGLLTAVGGGMIRDVMVGKVPSVFGGNTLYATVALIGSVEMLVFYHLYLPNLGMGIAIGTSAVLTLLARRRGWSLPGPAHLNASAVKSVLRPRVPYRKKRKAQEE